MSRKSRSRKRRRNRGRLGPLFKLLCLAALVVALTVGATVFFRVEVVAVVGNSRYTQEEIVAASGIQAGDNLYGMNKYKIDEALRQSLPYIGEVMIRRSPPSTIVITVKEWDAVAQILPPSAQEAAAAQAEMVGDGEDGDGSGQPVLPPVAQEPWLISVKGKLLEPAPAGSTAIAVSGLAALMPEAGAPLAIPPSQQDKLDSLLKLLDALEEAEMTADISAVSLGSTQIEMRYLNRYTVKVEMNADFRYELQVMRTVREDIEERHGPGVTGTLDLTQEGYAANFSKD